MTLFVSTDVIVLNALLIKKIFLLNVIYHVDKINDCINIPNQIDCTVGHIKLFLLILSLVSYYCEIVNHIPDLIIHLIIDLVLSDSSQFCY